MVCPVSFSEAETTGNGRLTQKTATSVDWRTSLKLFIAELSHMSQLAA
jgi:hypothetical protein